MRVYIVRHGESQNNKDKLWTGWYDAPLTEKGRERLNRYHKEVYEKLSPLMNEDEREWLKEQTRAI